MKEVYILEKSKRKGKRFVIIMPDRNHRHDFGSDVGKTFIDHKDLKKKKNWEARHKSDRNYNSKHSGIYFSKNLLWTEPTLNKAIKKLELKDNIKIINKV